MFEPHGLGVSSDGQWIYLPTGEGSFMTMGEHAGRFLDVFGFGAKAARIAETIRQYL